MDFAPISIRRTFNFFLLLYFILIQHGFAQLSDDFSDGDLNQNPVWSGDTAHFIVNAAAQLQLSAPAITANSYLVTPSDIINEAVWSFYVKLDFNPSSTNYMDVYLVSDQADLRAPLNGYFVRIGNTQDEISLYRQAGQRSQAIKIIDGADKRIDLNVVELNIKVTKNPEALWELLVDPGMTGSYVSEGTATDSQHQTSHYFGVFCQYTQTRSTRFYFDDLLIMGEPFVDDDPPELDSLIVAGANIIHLYFSEHLDSTSALDPDNYFVGNGIGHPSTITMIAPTSVLLEFEQIFPDRVENQISVHGIYDLYENEVKNLVVSFTYHAPYTVRFGDLLITEIMADPSPAVDLPEYEYLEIFNNSPEKLVLSGFYLAVGNDSVPIPVIDMDPGEFVIFCQSAAVPYLQEFGNAVRIPNWPTLNNRGERVSIYSDKGHLIFTVEYTDAWYESIDKKDGGWSLEMIDTAFPCKGRENWRASVHPSGGTPGKPNSHPETLIDLHGPEINRTLAVNEQKLMLLLSEKIKPQLLNPGVVSFSPGLAIDSLSIRQPHLDVIDIWLADKILPNTQYQITVKSLTDCAGNRTETAIAGFVLPAPADSLDLIINEILFNPWPNGYDFVELYNRSDKYINLKDWKLGNNQIFPITTDHFILEPKQFLVLTENFEMLNNHYPGIDPKRVLQVAKLPAFNNDQGEVRLIDPADKLMDYFSYREEYHSTFLRDVKGVSLERISFDRPTNDPVNWQSAAASAGYATPGRMNSQYYSGAMSGEEVLIDPPVFDPSGGGVNNYTLIKCRFDQPGNMASIKVLDAAGRAVKTIASHHSIGTEEVFRWEGENDQGQEVRMGYYIVYLEIYNADGARKIFRKKVVVGGRM